MYTAFINSSIQSPVAFPVFGKSLTEIIQANPENEIRISDADFNDVKTFEIRHGDKSQHVTVTCWDEVRDFCHAIFGVDTSDPTIEVRIG